MLAFSALADPTRFHIVEMLAVQGRMPVADISRHFEMSAPAISQHLKVLRLAHLVQIEIKAQQRIYSLNSEGMRDIEDWLTKTKRLWNARFDAFDAVVLEETEKSKIGD